MSPTWKFLRSGLTDHTSAAAPATIGAAKLVPSAYAQRAPPTETTLAQSPSSKIRFAFAGTALKTPSSGQVGELQAPGATRLTQSPKFENQARPPYWSLAPTERPRERAPL